MYTNILHFIDMLTNLNSAKITAQNGISLCFTSMGELMEMQILT
jgi:hypothetical protein